MKPSVGRQVSGFYLPTEPLLIWLKSSWSCLCFRLHYLYSFMLLNKGIWNSGFQKVRRAIHQEDRVGSTLDFATNQSSVKNPVQWPKGPSSVVLLRRTHSLVAPIPGRKHVMLAHSPQRQGSIGESLSHNSWEEVLYFFLATSLNTPF